MLIAWRGRLLAAGAIVVLVAAGLIAAAVLRPPALGASTTLAILGGTVEVLKAGADLRAGEDGEVLGAGDRVRTGAASYAVITFFDGSTVALDPSTTVAIERLEARDGAVLIAFFQSIGRTWSSVVRLADPRSRYEVRTPALSAAVRSTGFEVVVAADGTTTVRVSDGEVIASAQGVAVTLGPGTTTVVAPGSPPPPPAPLPAPPARLRFGAHSPVQIVVSDPVGRACGDHPAAGVVRQVPRCLVSPGTEPALVDLELNDPQQSGPYLVSVMGTADGEFTLSATGLVGTRVAFNHARGRRISRGEVLLSRITITLFGDLLTSGGLGEFEPASAPLAKVQPKVSPTILPPAPSRTPNVALFSPIAALGGFGATPVPTPSPTSAPTLAEVFRLSLIGVVPPRVPPNPLDSMVMYRFATGIRQPGGLSKEQIEAGISFPSICGCGWGSEEVDGQWVFRLFMSPSAPAGPHVLALRLPDGRRAEVEFVALPAEATWSISGRVTSASSGVPLSNITVSATAFDVQGRNVLNRGSSTDAAGSYLVRVPRDAPSVSYYWVSFDPRGGGSRYVQQSWKNVSLFPLGVPTKLTVTGDVSGIDAALEEGYYLTGRVTSKATGTPLGGVLVVPQYRGAVARIDLRPPSPLDAVAALGVLAATGPSAVTDASGNWQFLAPAGRYVIQFSPHLQKGYVEQWWRGARTYDAATEVVVRGADVDGLDAAMESAP